MIFPVVLIGALIGSASSVLQIGFLNVEDALSFDMNKMNPVEGFKRIFSLRSLVEGLKSILKFILIASAVYFILKGEVYEFGTIATMSVAELMS